MKKIVGNTDKGLVRKNNEDAFLIKEPFFSAVADGMGGYAAGEVASKMAVEFLKTAYDKGRFQNQENLKGVLKNTLKEVIEEINQEIYFYAQNDAENLSGMGTTLTVFYEEEGELYWANVGDSRLYLWRHQKLEQKTSDHSFVAELLKNRVITEEEAKVHPQKNMITRALGSQDNVEADIGSFKLKAGDYLLLCTDGLTNMLSDEEINEILIDAVCMEAAIKLLIEKANKHGGKDNITVVLAFYE